MTGINDILVSDYTKYSCQVLVHGQAMPSSYQLITLQVKQGYQHITSAEVIFKQTADLGADPESKLLLSGLKFEGAPLKVKATNGKEEISLFEGYVVKYRFTASSAGVRFHITAKTLAINLAQRVVTETYASRTDQEIIDDMVSASGCSLNAGNTMGAFKVKHTQLVKTGINDWDFINIRAEANSCFVYTEKDDVVLDKPSMVPDPMKTISATLGGEVYELVLDEDERKYQWESRVIGFNLDSHETEAATENAEPAMGKVKGKKDIINYKAFNDMEDNDLLDAESQRKKYSKKNGTVQIKPQLKARPGWLVDISGYNSLIDGKYLITSVMQDYSDGIFSTYLQFGLNYLRYEEKFHLTQHLIQPVLVTGIVKKLEKDPDNLYRIQVKISNWDKAQEMIWARMSTVYAGDKHGLVCLPEIDDEVIIGFMGTGHDTPVVLGSVFSPKNIPHTEFKDDNHEKLFVTRKGMKWLWNDDKGIHEISTPNGNKIRISEEDKSIVLEDENQNKVEMNQSSIEINGSKDVVIKAAANLKMEGAAVDIKASGNVTIKGSMVMIN